MSIVTRGLGRRSRGLVATFGFGRVSFAVVTEAFREVIDFCVYVVRELRFDVER